MSEQLTNQTVELLQTLIRNRCVNDGTAESGHEVRNADTLRQFLGSTGLDLQQYEAAPGRASLVARIEGSDPDAPSLCLMGHTDVVPVSEAGWTPRSVRRRAGRRRGVGSRRGRHAEPDRVDGGRLPAPGRHAASGRGAT